MSAESVAGPRRHRFRWPSVLVLTAVWVLLWGELSVANVVSGLAVASVVFAVFPLPPVAFGGRIRPIGLARLLGRFAADLAVASVEVAVLALRTGRRPTSAVIQVDLRSDSDLYLVLTAELLTLLPGSIVIETRRSTSTLFVHLLDVRNEADIERTRRQALEQEARVMHALASSAELDAYRRASEGANG
ncbi:multisubunit sodium/proton antiporter MrpE subunit [Haloactinopolyspora alba]|uniref:Multisubunit sodium/proton antiporter MrpE subunit n=1 Tax=Haloactinopolyspora alba TaxID=648780 RepID=A0A2P8E2G9_9ACTN|nr:Na+/H+ antiporter subunit E [Haloactinopolyspora alba]PSL03680.1 multisubunit sodium/proton antiporter MrpE subunit [Haloactinopolyspora alba]